MLYSPDRRRYSSEAKPEQYLTETWDNPAKLAADLKRFGLGMVGIARRFVRNVINSLPKNPS